MTVLVVALCVLGGLSLLVRMHPYVLRMLAMAVVLWWAFNHVSDADDTPMPPLEESGAVREAQRIIDEARRGKR